MARPTRTLAALVLLPLVGAAQQEDEEVHVAPPAPILLQPADDPDDTKCFAPDPDEGIKFSWRLGALEPGGDDYPVASYIDIRRWEGPGEGWRPYFKTYANPPFTLRARPRVFDADFAWRVWAVDRSGKADPYAVRSKWHLFCTLPASEPVPYGSTQPPR